jgi:hypothetical protein
MSEYAYPPMRRQDQVETRNDLDCLPVFHAQYSAIRCHPLRPWFRAPVSIRKTLSLNGLLRVQPMSQEISIPSVQYGLQLQHSNIGR